MALPYLSPHPNSPTPPSWGPNNLPIRLLDLQRRSLYFGACCFVGLVNLEDSERPLISTKRFRKAIDLYWKIPKGLQFPMKDSEGPLISTFFFWASIHLLQKASIYTPRNVIILNLMNRKAVSNKLMQLFMLLFDQQFSRYLLGSTSHPQGQNCHRKLRNQLAPSTFSV